MKQITQSLVILLALTTPGMSAHAQMPRVAIMVEASLLSALESDIDRLAKDLKADGYAAFTKSWKAKKKNGARAVWQFLKNEHAAAKGLRGAILVGHIPLPSLKMKIGKKSRSVNSDLPYWIMSEWKPRKNVRLNIWVSRLSGTSKRNKRLYVGHEITLLKRALQANHDYRRGHSRLPHAAYGYKNAVHKDYVQDNRGALEIWPNVYSPKNVLQAFIDGGEFLQVQSHGNAVVYTKGVSLGNIHDALAQTRVSAVSVTHGFGGLGGLGFQSLFTRGGGNVLNFGASAFAGFASSYTSVAMLGPRQAPFRANLARGMSWGDALLKSYIINDPGVIFMGDLSLRPMPHPSNKLPKITRFRAAVRSGVAPLTVKFDGAATDADGQITQYEWFLEGHGYGKVSPSFTSKQALSAHQHVFHMPRRYLARLEVMDNYKARAYKDVVIAVAPQPGTPVRINAGRYPDFHSSAWDRHESYKPDLDIIDTEGRIWMHDQRHGRGTWGWTERMRFNATSKNIKLSGAPDPVLFHSNMSGDVKRKRAIEYRIPLAADNYQVNLGFVEFSQATKAGMREMDISLEGELKAARFDILKEAGAARQVVIKSLQTKVTDGELNINITGVAPKLKTKQAPKNPVIYFIEVLPDGFKNAAPRASILVTKKSANGEVNFAAKASDADGDPLRYDWNFDDGHSAYSAVTSHRFTEQRVHDVRLTVFDGRGSAAVATQRIRLGRDGIVVQ